MTTERNTLSLKQAETAEQTAPATAAPAEPAKKGTRSWRPAERMALVDKKPGLEYRWCDGDPAAMRRHEANGWTPASKIHGNQASNSEKQGTSVTEYRGMVLCTIGKEDFQTHRDYYAEQTLKQTVGLKNRLRDQNRQSASGTPADIHGTIVIS